MDNPRLAVIIDADNAHPTTLKEIMSRIDSLGTATVRRIYGDFTSPQLKAWKEHLPLYSITPVQTFSYTVGKNSTDSSMIIDAMDLLYRGNLDGFCIVSSDSDFTRLASRIREDGCLVYGFGRKDTPDAFIQSCTEFFYHEYRRPKKAAIPKKKLHKATPEALTSDDRLMALLRRAVRETANTSGFASLADVGNRLAAIHSGFSPKLYGYKKTADLYKAIRFFEVVHVKRSEQGRTTFIGERDGNLCKDLLEKSLLAA